MPIGSNFPIKMCSEDYCMNQAMKRIMTFYSMKQYLLNLDTSIRHKHLIVSLIQMQTVSFWNNMPTPFVLVKFI